MLLLGHTKIIKKISQQPGTTTTALLVVYCYVLSENFAEFNAVGLQVYLPRMIFRFGGNRRKSETIKYRKTNDTATDCIIYYFAVVVGTALTGICYCVVVRYLYNTYMRKKYS